MCVHAYMHVCVCMHVCVHVHVQTWAVSACIFTCTVCTTIVKYSCACKEPGHRKDLNE